MRESMCTRIVGLILVHFSVLFAIAQEPFVPSERSLSHGRPLEGSSLSFCVDLRDPAHEVEQAIATEITQALLVEANFRLIDREVVISSIDQVYLDLHEHCSVYLGFKLIANVFPDWMMPTRPYYQARYVLIVKEAGWNSLADIPTSQPIGAGIGTVGDLRLIQYLKTLQPENRWPRHPMSSDEAALKSLLEGSLAAALVWEPSLWAARQRDPAFEKLRVISSGQLSESPVGVGGIVASDNTFVRSAIDDAIAALTADGTIDRLLNHYDFPAAAPGH